MPPLLLPSSSPTPLLDPLLESPPPNTPRFLRFPFSPIDFVLAAPHIPAPPPPQRPVVLKQSVLVEWDAFEKWTPSHLAANLRWVEAYRQDDDPEFITWHDDKMLEPLVTTGSWERYNTLHNVTLLPPIPPAPTASIPPGADAPVDVASAARSSMVYRPGLPAYYFSSEIGKLRERMPSVQ